MACEHCWGNDIDEKCDYCGDEHRDADSQPSAASAGSPLMVDMAMTVKGFIPHLTVFRDTLLVHGIEGVGNANHFITAFSDLLERYELGER